MPTIKKLEFATGTDVTAPADLSLESSTNNLETYVDDAAFVAANGTAGEGDVYLNTTLKAPRSFISGAWRTGIMINDAADPTKTVGFDLTGSTTGTAQTLDFDNTASRVYTFPNYAGRIVVQTGTETNPVLFASATGNIDIGNAASTTRIVGNLEVQGTTTTFNTQTVQVEDNNMILNFGGNDTTAQGSGLQVDRTGTDGSFIYDSAAATKWKAGNLGSEVEIVDKSTAQALTNKTIDASLNTISNIGSSMLTGTVAPSKGGTGVANNDAATLTRSGNHALTVTTTAPTNVTLPASGTLATLAGAEVLTNKDIDGGTASNTSRWTAPKATKTVLDSLTRKEGTFLYATDTKKHYTDDGITLNEMGGGAGGAAGRNYLQSWYTGLNPIASVTGLTSTGNRTSNQTLWGTSATADFEAINNVTSPLREGGDIKLDSKTTTINAFVETPMFSLDLVDLSKAIVLSFDVTGNSADGNYDVVVIRYNSSGTYQETISVAGNASSGTPASAKLPTGTTTFKGFFIAGATASDLYSVRFRKLLAVNNDVQIDSLFVGPQSLSSGAALTTWNSENLYLRASTTNPTAGSSNNTAYRWRQIGDSIHIKFYTRNAGTSGTAGSGEYGIPLPSGLTVNTSLMPNVTMGNNFVSGHGYITWGSSNEWVPIFFSYNQAANIFCYSVSGSGVAIASSNANAAGTPANANFSIGCDIVVPIAQWSLNVTTADRAVEECLATDSFSSAVINRSYAGSLLPITTPSGAFEEVTIATSNPWQTSWGPSDRVICEVDSFGDGKFIDVTASIDVCPFVNVGGTYYGIGFYNAGTSSSPQWRMIRGKYRNQNTSLWSTISTGARFRFRKVSGGASVGYPIAPGNIALMNTQDNYSGNTKMGLMSYAHGGSYKDGLAPTITLTAGGGTLSSVNASDFIPYQMADGSWRIKFNIRVSLSSTARTVIGLSINGVSFPAVDQGVSANNAGAAAATYAVATASTSTLTFGFASSVTDAAIVSGDVKLAIKPTWAY